MHPRHLCENYRPLSKAYPICDVKITVSGIYVHPRHHCLAASCDGELSVGPAPGIVELKVHASAALAWLVECSTRRRALNNLRMRYGSKYQNGLTT